jgi:diacylglycerol kinase (ATP)
MKPLLVVNPESGGGRTRKVFPDLKRAITARLGEVEIVFTERSGDGIRLAREGALAGHELVIAVGGDGTLNEVVNGLMEAGKPNTELGIIAQGTGGDFRRSINLEHRLDAYLSALAAEKTRPLDVGMAEYTAHDGTRKSRYFVNVLSAGMGGLVDQFVARSTRLFGGKAAYFGASLRALAAVELGRLSCTVHNGDNAQVHKISTYMIAICNGQFFGSGMHVAPMAEVDDGRFEIVALGPQSKVGIALTSNAIYDGKHLAQKGAVHLPCEKVDLMLDNQAAADAYLIDLDGEPVGKLPLSISVKKSALRLRA